MPDRPAKGRQPRYGLRPRLVGLSLLGVLPPVAVVAGLLWSALAVRTGDIGLTLMQAAREIRTRQDSLLDSTRVLLATLSADPTLGDAAPHGAAGCAERLHLAARATPWLVTLSLVDRTSHQILCQSGSPRPVPGLDAAGPPPPAARVVTRPGQDGGAVMIGHALTGSRPDLDLLAEIDVASLAAAMMPIAAPTGSEAALLTGDGNLLARSAIPGPGAAAGEEFGTAAVQRAAALDSDGWLTAPVRRGESRILGFARMQALQGAVIVVSLDRQVALAPLHHAAAIAALILGASAAMAVTMVLLFGARTIARRVERIAEAADRLARGDLAARAPSGDGGDELDRLAEAFNGMAESLESARARQRESETRFRLLADHAGDIVALHAIDGFCLYISPSVERALGYQPDQIIGQNPLNFAHPDDRAGMTRNYRRLLRTSGTPLVYRWRCRKANGEYLWLETSARLAPAEDPAVSGGRIVAITRDVDTEVRQQQAVQAALAEARIARIQAERADRAKADFLATMSHELRTPLNAVIGFSRLLQQEEEQTARVEWAKDIEDAGEHLLALINDVLDLSKVEADALLLHRESVDLTDVVRSVARLQVPAAQRSGLTLSLELPETPVLVDADPKRLRQVLLNLLSNAVKFTPAGGRVVARVEQGARGELLLTLADTGIGMGEDELPVALAPFGQVENAYTRRHQGTGLGLPLAKRMVELHGWDFRIDSVPGQGTRILIRIPAPLTPAADPARAARSL